MVSVGGMFVMACAIDRITNIDCTTHMGINGTGHTGPSEFCATSI